MMENNYVFTKGYMSKHSEKKDVLVTFTLQETNEFQFISQKLYSREHPIAYSTWRKFDLEES